MDNNHQPYEFGYGLIRTPSGRITYAPDGMPEPRMQRGSNFGPLWPNEPTTPYESDADNELEPEYDLVPRQGPARDEPATVMPMQEPKSRREVFTPEDRASAQSFYVPDPTFLQRSYSDANPHNSMRGGPSRVSGTTYARSSRSGSLRDPFVLGQEDNGPRVKPRSSVISGTTRAQSERSSVDYKSIGDGDDRSLIKGKHGGPDAAFAALTAGEHSRDLEKQDGPPRGGPPGGGPPGGGPPGGGPPGGPPSGPKDPNLVDWDGKADLDNPMNWKVFKKWYTTIILAIMTFTVTFASSVFSTATLVTAQQFGVSTEVMTLGTSLFVLGFAFGPIVFGPMSELYGRKIPLFFGFFIFGVFSIAVAVAQNLWTIFICRFFGGFFASAPLAIVGATMNDFWEPVDRGVAVTVFSCAVFIGPIAGPIVGSFVVQSYLGWRWIEYITAFMAFGFGAVGFFMVNESFAPVLLHRRAKKLRHETKNWAIHSKADENEVNLKRIADTYLMRPFKMLAMEPILILITIYMALIYGILYLTFEAYPISFSEVRGWTPALASLPFLAVVVGVAFGAILIIWVTKTRFARKMRENHGRVVPEERLIPMIVGGAILPAWIVLIIAGIPIGMGIMVIFLQGLNYIIDVYKWNAASAIAANTFARSWVGAGFPLFATAMYNNLGVNWATSLLGFLCVALFPVPILFYIFGAKIRAKGKYVPQMGPPGGRPGGGPPGGGPPGGGPPGGGPPGAGGPPGGKPGGGSGPPGEKSDWRPYSMGPRPGGMGTYGPPSRPGSLAPGHEDAPPMPLSSHGVSYSPDSPTIPLATLSPVGEKSPQAPNQEFSDVNHPSVLPRAAGIETGSAVTRRSSGVSNYSERTSLHRGASGAQRPNVPTYAALASAKESGSPVSPDVSRPTSSRSRDVNNGGNQSPMKDWEGMRERQLERQQLEQRGSSRDGPGVQGGAAPAAERGVISRESSRSVGANSRASERNGAASRGSERNYSTPMGYSRELAGKKGNAAGVVQDGFKL